MDGSNATLRSEDKDIQKNQAEVTFEVLIER